MKNALIITTISGFVPQFEMNNVNILQNMGYKVHYASNFQNPHYGFDNHRLDGTGIVCHQVDFVRSPFRIRENLRAYRQLKAVLEEIPFDLVHCHTPMGGVLGRLAVENVRKKRAGGYRRKFLSKQAKVKSKNGQIKVIYTAHGFHFFHGASLVNWMFYYPVERWLAHDTDVLITINEEDYVRAQKFHLRQGGKVWKVNGVGISLLSSKEKPNREAIRRKLGILPDEFVFLSIGELSRRKNHQIVIKALKELEKKKDISNIRYMICGEGKKHNKLERLIKKHSLEKNVILMGYQEEIQIFLDIADCFIFPSLQEGLPVALLEAMKEGLPIIASKIRGSSELLEKEGYLVAVNDKYQLSKAMQKVMAMKKGRQKYTKLELYSAQHVKKQMEEIYQG